jgi:hypothetical protein
MQPAPSVASNFQSKAKTYPMPRQFELVILEVEAATEQDLEPVGMERLHHRGLSPTPRLTWTEVIAQPRKARLWNDPVASSSIGFVDGWPH